MNSLSSPARMMPILMMWSILAIGCSDRGFKLAENNELIEKVLGVEAGVEAQEAAEEKTLDSLVSSGQIPHFGFSFEEIKDTVEHLISEDQQRREDIRTYASALEGDEIYDVAQEKLVEKILQSTGQFIKGVRIAEASPLKSNSDYSELERTLIVHVLMKSRNGQRAAAVGGLNLKVDVGSAQSSIARVDTVKWDQQQVFGEKVVLSAWCMNGICSSVRLIVEDRFNQESLVADFADTGDGTLALVNSQFAVETEFSLLERATSEEADEEADEEAFF